MANVLTSSLDLGSALIGIGVLVFIVLYIVIGRKRALQKKPFVVNKLISQELVERYMKRKKNIFKGLKEKDYYMILDVSSDDPLDYIYDVYLQIKKKYELKPIDIENYPNALKEEAVKNIALAEYSYQKIKKLKN